nr:MAG TPA: hypothetical protein [Caudoviricetes sp.]
MLFVHFHIFHLYSHPYLIHLCKINCLFYFYNYIISQISGFVNRFWVMFTEN